MTPTDKWQGRRAAFVTPLAVCNMISLLILCCVLIVAAVKKLIPYLRIYNEIRKLPGPQYDSILFGNMGPLIGPSEEMFRTLRKWSLEYYPIYKGIIAHIHFVNLIHPHDFETVLSSAKHTAKTEAYSTLHGWLETGLLTSEGSKWQRRRKILSPAFHFNILQEFLKVFKKESDKLVQVLKSECHKPNVELQQCINTLTLNTIAETAMGLNLDREAQRGQEYRRAVEKMGKIIVYRSTHPWLLAPLLYFFHPNKSKEDQLVKTLHQFTENVIARREENFQLMNQTGFNYSKNKRLAMLDLLLTSKKENGTIDQRGIREEVDTFMFAGHDTTASAICQALMLFACHHQVQEQLVDEMRQVLKDSTVNYQTLQELRYMERCIKEVLRLYPSVPVITRILGEDITTYSGHNLKAGTKVHLLIFDLHHCPEIYPEPEKFDPDRFLPENSQNRHKFAHVPFSAGPRNCIGQKFAMLEMKTVLCSILSEFVLEPVDTPDSMVLAAEIILRTTTPIRVKFVPRANPVITS